MEGVLSNSGYGYAGYGFSYVDGSGYGCGCGSDCGYGSGYADGYGYGYAGGEKISEIAGYRVLFNTVFGVIQVGCVAHTLSEWQQNWRQIAKDYKCEVSEADVAELLKRIRDEIPT
jgi:hypothetical protein